MEGARDRLVVVSNRLPFVFEHDDVDGWRSKQGSGGLVSALVPVLRDRGGLWIGWPGVADGRDGLDAAVKSAGMDLGFSLEAIHLDVEEVRGFYEGFSNEVVWPLFHDLQSLCDFQPGYWDAYRRVNRKFATAVRHSCADADFIWVHDYHLMNVAAEARASGCRARIGFFLHIPFPSPDIFLKLPWRLPLLQALFDFDVIGFQTQRDRRNFIQCARSLLHDVEVQGKGHVVTVRAGGKSTRVGYFPIGIDYASFVEHAALPEVRRRAEDLRFRFPECQIMLGVDRLDYTKGIPHRLRALDSALRRHPELHGRISLLQVVVPSRTGIRDYAALKTEIEQLVGDINGRYTRPGEWIPVWYVYNSLGRRDLLAYYRAADIALVTPLKDGMNLVAKEYCACSIDENCVLILSEFAGAAEQLRRGALLVNPHDADAVGDSINDAVVMGHAERRARMRRLRRSVLAKDIFWWVDSFLTAAFSRDLATFPRPEDASPRQIWESDLPI